MNFQMDHICMPSINVMNEQNFPESNKPAARHMYVLIAPLMKLIFLLRTGLLRWILGCHEHFNERLP